MTKKLYLLFNHRRKKKCIRFANADLDGSNGGCQMVGPNGQIYGPNGQLYPPGSAMFSNGSLGENSDHGGSMNGGISEDDYDDYEDETDDDDDDDENETDDSDAISEEDEENHDHHQQQQHHASSMQKLDRSRKNGDVASNGGYHANSPHLAASGMAGNGGGGFGGHMMPNFHHNMAHPNKKPNLGSIESGGGGGGNDLIDSKHDIRQQIQQMQQQMKQ